MSKLNLRSAFAQINLNMSQKKFLRNSVIALVGWFFLADAVPVHNFFTDILTESSQKTIAFLSDKIPSTMPVIQSNGKLQTHLWDDRGHIMISFMCNGWDLYYLCIAFIAVFPGYAIKRKLIFSLVGFVALFGSNVMRIVGLFYIHKIRPEWFDMFHHTIFQGWVYIVMFIIWIIYLRQKKEIHPSES